MSYIDRVQAQVLVDKVKEEIRNDDTIVPDKGYRTMDAQKMAKLHEAVADRMMTAGLPQDEAVKRASLAIIDYASKLNSGWCGTTNLSARVYNRYAREERKHGGISLPQQDERSNPKGGRGDGERGGDRSPTPGEGDGRGEDQGQGDGQGQGEGGDSDDRPGEDQGQGEGQGEDGEQSEPQCFRESQSGDEGEEMDLDYSKFCFLRFGSKPSAAVKWPYWDPSALEGALKALGVPENALERVPRYRANREFIEAANIPVLTLPGMAQFLMDYPLPEEEPEEPKDPEDEEGEDGPDDGDGDGEEQPREGDGEGDGSPEEDDPLRDQDGNPIPQEDLGLPQFPQGKRRILRRPNGKHYMCPDEFDTAAIIISNGFNLILEGVPGCGKTEMGMAIADLLDVPVFIVTSPQERWDVIGFKDAEGRPVTTDFVKAYISDCVLILDEMDRSLTDALICVNSALANEILMTPDGQKLKHPNCRIIACTNTNGRGPTKGHATAVAFDDSTLDRFVTLRVNYCRDIELFIANGDEALVDFLDDWRECSQRLEFDSPVISYRGVANLVHLKDREGLMANKEVGRVQMMLDLMTVEGDSRLDDSYFADPAKILKSAISKEVMNESSLQTLYDTLKPQNRNSVYGRALARLIELTRQEGTLGEE